MAKQVQATSISTEGTLGQTPASQIARKAIPILEKAIHDRFGLTVKMGAELEFSVIPSDRLKQSYEKKDLGADPLRMGSKPFRDYRPSNIRPKSSKIPIFSESPAICYGYHDEIDGETELGTFKYEYVFSHDTGRDLQFLADEITDTKRVMQGKSPSFSHHERLNPKIKQPFPDRYWKWISFDPVLPYYPLHAVDIYFRHNAIEARRASADANALDSLQPTHGLHFNVSLLSDGGGIAHLNQQNIAADLPTTIALGIYQIMKEGALAMDSASSFMRREKGYAKRSQIVVRDEGDRADMRIENRLPDASCDPHIGVMLNLVGVYHALDAMKFEKDTQQHQPAPHLQTISTDDEIPINRKDQMNAFKSGTLIKDTLNGLDGGIGDAFHKAVMDEKTKQAKRTR